MFILKGNFKLPAGKNSEEETAIEAPQQNRTQVIKQDNVAKTYDCLSGDTWEKTELEKEPELNGFFNDIIQCNTDKLLGYWRTHIDSKANPKWGQLLEALEQPNPNLLRGFHLNSNQSSVSINTYIKFMNDFISNTQATRNTAQPAPKKHNKPATNTGGNSTID